MIDNDVNNEALKFEKLDFNKLTSWLEKRKKFGNNTKTEICSYTTKDLYQEIR